MPFQTGGKRRKGVTDRPPRKGCADCGEARTGQELEMITQGWCGFSFPPLLPPIFGGPLVAKYAYPPLYTDSLRFYKSHAVYGTFGGVVVDREEGDRIARALGAHNKAAILQNHGLLTVGQTVDEVSWFLNLERTWQAPAACRRLQEDVHRQRGGAVCRPGAGRAREGLVGVPAVL